MAGFSVISASTEGFHLIKNNPLAVFVWLLVYMVAVAVVIGLIGATVGFAALANLTPLMDAATQKVTPDKDTLIAVLSALGGAVAIAAIGAMVVDAVLVTAVKRAVLRPEERTVAYMRLGADEVRTFFVRLVQFLIFIGVYLVVGGGTVALGRLIHPLLGVLWCIVGVVGMIFLVVRLSLGVSQSFAERRFTIFGSWALSKGRFWPILGAYILAFIFFIIVWFVLNLIASLAGGGFYNPTVFENPGDFDFNALMGVGLMVSVVVGLICETLELSLLGAPPAAIYRDIAAGDPS